MTNFEIIKESVLYYSEDITRRGIVSTPLGKQGVYFDKTLNVMCIVGRCINPNKIDPSLLTGDVGEFIEISIKQGISSPDVRLEDILKEQYKGHDVEFWDNLQSLHDLHMYWEPKTGLTPSGIEYLKHILEKWAPEHTIDDIFDSSSIE